jgi:molybdopterin converting factor small subunit
VSEATLLIPQALRAFTEGADRVTVRAETVGEALRGVPGDRDGFVSRVLTPEGELRPLVNVFVGETSIRVADGLETVLADGDVIAVIPAVAGG